MVAMTKLEDEITRVRGLIDKVRDRSDSLNEQDTKAAFIEPVLAALGWDVRDLDDVSQQYRYKPQDNPVDYALFMMRTPCLFVEAKALRKNLADHKWITQTLAYANAAGVEWCVLTNGEEYHLYNSHAKVDAEGKLFRRISISDARAHRFTVDTLMLLSKDRMAEKRIDTLWKAHFVDRQVQGAIERVFREPAERFVKLMVDMTTDLKPAEVRDSLRRCELRVSFPVDPAVAAAASLPEAVSKTAAPASTAPENGVAGKIKLIDLIKTGIVKPPLEVEATYKATRVTAIIQPDGTVVFDGTPYPSLSQAAGMVGVRISGPPPDGRPIYRTNGWTFWRFKDTTTGALEPMDTLRTIAQK